MRYFTVPGMGMFDVDGLEAGHPRVLLTRNTTRFRALNSRLDRGRKYVLFHLVVDGFKNRRELRRLNCGV